MAMGATASMLWWPEALLDILADGGFRVIRFDQRDTGKSTTNSPGDIRYDVNDLAEDLIAILDARDTSSAHLVGMSLGGYVSPIAALKYPSRVRSLALIASEPLGMHYEGEGIDPALLEHFRQMETLDWSDPDAVIDFELRIAELSAGSHWSFDPAAARARIVAELGRTGSIQSAFNHSMVGGDISPQFEATALSLPVLVIHGTDDPIISIEAASRPSRRCEAPCRSSLRAGAMSWPLATWER